MLVNTKNILDLANAIEQQGQVLYLEVINESIAKRCASRLTKPDRFAHPYKDRRYSTRLVLAVSNATHTQLLLRIERLL